MAAMTATQARQEFFPLLKRVNEDATPIEIVSKHGNAVLMSADEFNAWRETAYLLSSPANAARLAQAMRDADAGNFEAHPLTRP